MIAAKVDDDPLNVSVPEWVLAAFNSPTVAPEVPIVPTPPVVSTAIAAAVAKPVPRPLTPVLIGSPVAFVRVALVGVPRTGVTKVGDVDSTMLPVPVTEFERVTAP
jgi:hypothetical protein